MEKEKTKKELNHKIRQLEKHVQELNKRLIKAWAQSRKLRDAYWHALNERDKANGRNNEPVEQS